MRLLPSITDAGRAFLACGERRLVESARDLTRAAGGTDAAASDASAPAAVSDGDPVAAAVGTIDGRTAFAMGVRLIEVGRDVGRMLVDVLA